MVGPESVDEAYDEGVITEVISPAAVVPEEGARAILAELALNRVRSGGLWLTRPTRWDRYDRPWEDAAHPGEAGLIGSIQVAHGTPTKYEITIARVTITALGSQLGFSARALSNEALGFGGLTLTQCARASMSSPPKPYRF
jgi:hypothetical protein